MYPPTRSEAQQRADEIRTFRGELARLETEGILRLSTEPRSDGTAVWFGDWDIVLSVQGLKPRRYACGLRPY